MFSRQMGCEEDSPMSVYRKAFLLWWTALVLFIGIFLYVNRGPIPPITSDSPLFAGLVVIFAFGSWIPGAFLRLLRPSRPFDNDQIRPDSARSRPADHGSAERWKSFGRVLS
jgi:hypothetical protein